MPPLLFLLQLSRAGPASTGGRSFPLSVEKEPRRTKCDPREQGLRPLQTGGASVRAVMSGDGGERYLATLQDGSHPVYDFLMSDCVEVEKLEADVLPSWECSQNRFGVAFLFFLQHVAGVKVPTDEHIHDGGRSYRWVSHLIQVAIPVLDSKYKVKVKTRSKFDSRTIILWGLKIDFKRLVYRARSAQPEQFSQHGEIIEQKDAVQIVLDHVKEYIHHWAELNGRRLSWEEKEVLEKEEEVVEDEDDDDDVKDTHAEGATEQHRLNHAQEWSRINFWQDRWTNATSSSAEACIQQLSAPNPLYYKSHIERSLLTTFSDGNFVAQAVKARGDELNTVASSLVQVSKVPLADHARLKSYLSVKHMYECFEGDELLVSLAFEAAQALGESSPASVENDDGSADVMIDRTGEFDRWIEEYTRDLFGSSPGAAEPGPTLTSEFSVRQGLALYDSNAKVSVSAVLAHCFNDSTLDLPESFGLVAATRGLSFLRGVVRELFQLRCRTVTGKGLNSDMRILVSPLELLFVFVLVAERFGISHEDFYERVSEEVFGLFKQIRERHAIAAQNALWAQLIRDDSLEQAHARALSFFEARYESFHQLLPRERESISRATKRLVRLLRNQISIDENV